MATDKHERLRGSTPRPSVEYSQRPSLPAELSQLNEILRDALADVLSERTASSESMIAARVKVDTHRGLKRYRWAVGGLAGALATAISWGASQVVAYGDGRAEAARAAIAAEAKAEEASKQATETQDQLADHGGRIDHLEQKVDRALVLLEGLAAREEPSRIDVKAEPKGRRRGPNP